MSHSLKKWEAVRVPNSITHHTLIVGGVLCRWWGELEPPGAKVLDGIEDRLVRLANAIRMARGYLDAHDYDNAGVHVQAALELATVPEEFIRLNPQLYAMYE